MYQAHADLERDHWWFVGRRAVVAEVIERRIGPGVVGPVLDLGCGTGGMLPLLSRYGPVTGIEPELFAVERARRQDFGGRVLQGAIPDDVPRSGDHALVTAFDVIEHLDDDVGALRAMRDAARPTGHVLVTVPALTWLWSGHDVANGHKRRYHRRGLVEALQGAGLQVCHVSYFNAALLAPIAAIRLLGRLRPGTRPGRSDFDLGIPPAPANRALAATLGAERRLVAGPGLPVGVSLIALATTGRP